MSERKIKRALISVYDKTGIVDFARALVDEFGIEIISTGGTAKLLKENDIPVTLVEQITGFPEMLDGRVKTLHPKIHAAILADRDNPEHMRQLAEQGIEPIDMVVVNLYPFEETVKRPDCTFEQAIEMIDIGGVCLLRAAAKNNRHVWAVDGSVPYPDVLKLLRGAEVMGDHYARKSKELFGSQAFEHLVRSEAAIASWMSPSPLPGRVLVLPGLGQLRYGENPHQTAELRGDRFRGGEAGVCSPSLAETGMSFNNFLDGNSSLELCKEVSRAGTLAEANKCIFTKHTNPCGAGIARDCTEAYRRAYLGDPNAAMGGVLACSFPVMPDFARAVMETYDRWGKAAGAGGFFVEVWVAPDFDKDAVEVIKTAKKWGQRVRLLAVGDMAAPPDENTLEYRSISGGMLVQTRDLVGLNEDQWKVVTRRGPSESEMADLRLAWLIAKHTKSNAISICRDGMLIGNGAGQMSRVMSCRIATWLAKENGHEEKLKGAAAASDAFFPFADGPNILIDAGVTAIIQPGGSKRDEEVIAACDARGVAMIFTGTRHFRH